MALKVSGFYYSICRNLPLIDQVENELAKDQSPTKRFYSGNITLAPSCNITLGLALIFALVLILVFTLVPTLVFFNKFFRQFMKI